MKLFLIGGFLGSGKTTAIFQAVKYLQNAGKKAGVITNDQGTQQVDTQYIRLHSIPVEEVAGSCFCCNLPELDKNINSLIHGQQPGVIFAESVGSCTDLIATVVNPLLNVYGSQLDITLSVFADIQVLLAWLQGKNIFHDNVNYIYEMQLEEAEIIIVNKIDLLTDLQLREAKKLIEKQYGNKKILYQSSFDIESISSWVRIMYDYQDPALRPTLELDYDKYGAGEAEMAWLDEEIGILTHDKNAVATGILFINSIYATIIKLGYPIGHLKFLLNDSQNQQKISFTSISQTGVIQENKALKTDRVVILINARVQTDPTALNNIVCDAIDELESSTGCKVTEGKRSFFKPGFPKPSQRIAH